MRFATSYKGLAIDNINKQQYVEFESRLNKCTKIEAKSIKEKH